MEHSLTPAPWTLSRRSMLAGAGSVAATALAGCLGGTRTGGTPSTDGRPGSTASPTAPGPLGGHPAAAGLSAQPTRGPDPAEADAVIVAFEDPSCTRCRVFERETVPRIESELVDTGRASFVFRGYPVVYPWGEPATQALESTFARDPEAFWALKDHYFAEQSTFTTENVLERTRAFLAANTGLDADAVVADAETRAHDAAVQADLSAGMNAGAGRTTPTVFLFSGGSYRTKAAGSVSYAVVENALGL